MQSVNPFNLQVISEYQEFSSLGIDESIETCHREFLNWKSKSFVERKEKLLKLAQILKEEKEELSELMTAEMGKTLKEGRAEVEKCAWVLEYYAENGEDFLKAEVIKTEFQTSEVHFCPLGVILAVMPWNFPFWQFLRVAAPTLMAGNTLLLKHASNVSGCALKIEELFLKAGFSKGAVKTLLVSSNKVEGIVKNPLVKGVSLTGSSLAGKSVGQYAGEALKPMVLELGGSDPYIILKDADLSLASQKCVQSRMINSGQSCIGAKRFIVVKEVYDRFKELLIKEMEKYQYGDPKNESTHIGPLARVDLRDELHDQVTRSLDAGATLVMGGFIPKEQGAFYPPTLIENIKKGMPAYHEEFFGPVATLIQVENEEEAISVANDTAFGLGGAVFTQDIERGKEIAVHQIESGACFVNDFVKSDPRLPFGGVKESGVGRELSHFGMKEFTNAKTICL